MNYIKCPKCGEEDPAFDYAHACGPVEVKRKVMNKQIKQLAEQAGLKIEYQMINPPKPLQILGSAEQFEKFAELIVRECAHVAVFKDDGMIATAEVAGYMAAGRSTAARVIKKHFGVEE